MRKRATALLEAIATWNDGQVSGRMRLVTQLSIDAARDLDLLRLAVRAGMDRCFIGIETPNEESLREVQKRQNMRVDLAGEVRKIVGVGLMPLCGMIVGFDHDGPDIFERQAKFIADIPAPVIQVGPLVAPHGTPLFDRIKSQGRLMQDSHLAQGNLIDTNIMPVGMSRDELRSGLRWLLNEVFDPDNWFRRLDQFAELAPANINSRSLRLFNMAEARLTAALARRGGREKQLVARLEKLARQRPDLISQIGYALIVYCQTRHVLDHFGLWNSAKNEGAAAASARMVSSV